MGKLTKRLGLGFVVMLMCTSPALAERKDDRRPNFVVFLMDDIGYGDLGCFGGTRAKTPNFDRFATQGTKFTDFYAHPVCGVTRAALMTRSYAMRVAEVGNRKIGHPILHPKEITLAEILRDAGYRTGIIGKWHIAGPDLQGRKHPFLRLHPDLLPNHQGFDYWFGMPTHNGFTRTIEGSKHRTRLMRQGKQVDDFVDQKEMDQLTTRFTDEANQFIAKNKAKPFFLFLSHSMGHVVLGASEKFRGKSGGGLYGDAIAELDWSAGKIVETLQEAGIDEQTLVIFTSDNGPWIEKQLKGKGGNDTHYGTAKPLRGAKMMTWEGGSRVPTIVRWPRSVPAGKVCREPATIMDLLPTFAKLANTKPPADRTIDGRDIAPLLRGEPNAKSPHEAIYYYAFTRLQAVRSGKWKLVAARPARPPGTSWSSRMIEAVKQPQLYNLETDVGETTNVADKHPETVERLTQLMENARDDIGDYNRLGKGARFFDEGPRRPASLLKPKKVHKRTQKNAT